MSERIRVNPSLEEIRNLALERYLEVEDVEPDGSVVRVRLWERSRAAWKPGGCLTLPARDWCAFLDHWAVNKWEMIGGEAEEEESIGRDESSTAESGT